MKKIKLFCIPYAGGSSTIYSGWKRKLDSHIELRPIELAGRGRRYDEPFYESIEAAALDIYNYIKDEVTEAPFAFYGHSMGSLLAFEVAHLQQERQGIIPRHIFFSGHRAPHMPRRDKITHMLPEEEFKQEILKLGGTPKDLLEEEELLELFLPLLRADFRIVENYAYGWADSKLSCDITVMNGKEDQLTLSEITEWGVHTRKKCKFIMFEGGHFFIRGNSEEIIKIINYTLNTDGR